MGILKSIDDVSFSGAVVKALGPGHHAEKHKKKNMFEFYAGNCKEPSYWPGRE